MHSSLDADRLDYLLRDSASAGVNYGLIDLDYLTRLFSIGLDKGEFGDRGKDVQAVGINVKGLHTLEHYLMARYFSYSQVTLHRTSSAFETLAKSLIWHLAENEKIYKDYKSILDIVNSKEFLAFDDSYLWGKIAEESNFDSLHKDYRFTLIERQRLKILIEIKDIRKKFTTPSVESNYYKLRSLCKSNINEIAEILEIPIEKVGYIEQELDIDSSLEDFEKDPKKWAESSRVFNDNKCIPLVKYPSSMIKDLFDKKLHIFRVFYIDPHPHDKDRSDSLVLSARKKLFDKYNIS